MSHHMLHPEGKAPREWAADILAGKIKLTQVPIHYRPMVEAHIKISQQIQKSAIGSELTNWVNRIMLATSRTERVELLGSCPDHLKRAVEAEVKSRFANK